MASTFADLLRARLAQGGVQTVPQSPQSYGGSTPGAIPVTQDQARLEAAQRVAAALLNAKLKQVRDGGGAATPQSQMTQPQLQAAGPAYGSQAARVAANPSVPQPIIVPDIRKDTYGGLADLQAQQSAANYVPQTQPTQSFSRTPVVPQAEDIRLLESNVNLPMTAEEATASLAKPDLIAGNEQFIADTQKRIDARTQELIGQGYDPMKAGMIAKQEVTDANLQWTRDHAGELPAPGPLEMVSEISNWYDAGRQAIVTEMGEGALRVANGQSDSYSPGWGRIAPANWGTNEININYAFGQWAQDPDNFAIIRNAGLNGFQADVNSPKFYGGEAVWELFINGRGLMYKTMSDIFNDPFILGAAAKPAGGALKTAGLMDAAEGRGIKAAIKYGAGSLLETPQNVMDATVDLPFNILGSAVGKIVSPVVASDSAIMKRIKSAFDGFTPTERTAVQDIRDPMQANLEYGGNVYEGYVPTGSGRSGPGGPGSSGTPNGPTPSGNPPAPAAGEYFRKVVTDAQGNKSWAIVSPDGTIHSDGYKWSAQKGREPNWNARDVQKVVNELNRPTQVAKMTNADIVVPPDSWQWADPTRPRLTSWGENQTTSGILFRMTSDLNIPRPIREAMIDDLTPAVEAHVKMINDIDARVTPGKKQAGVSGEEAIQSGKEIGDAGKTFENVRFYAQDVFPTWQKHMGVPLTETDFVFYRGADLNEKDVSSLIEHALFGTRNTDRFIEVKGKMVNDPISGTSARARKAIMVWNGVVGTESGGIRAKELRDRLRAMRVELFGEESLSTNPSAIKSRGAKERAAAVPKAEQMDAAATDMGAGVLKGQSPEYYRDLITKLADDPSLDMPPMPELDALIPVPSKTKKPKYHINPMADDASIVRALATENAIITTKGGLRVFREHGGVKMSAGSKKDANDITIKIVLKDDGKYSFVRLNNDIIKGVGETEAMRADTLGEAIELGEQWLRGRIGSPADVSAAKSLIRKLDPNKTAGIVSPGTQRGMQADANFSRLIQEREGAVTGLGLDDVVANRDSTPLGAALRVGMIDQETYTGLSQIVRWGGRNMPLYTAYEQLRMSGMEHREAVDMLVGVLAPFPNVTINPKFLARWWQKVFASQDSWYMTTLTAMRQQQQYNLANGMAKTLGDQIGNIWTLMATGNFSDAFVLTVDLPSYLKFARIERGNKELLDHTLQQFDATGIKPRNSMLELNSGRTEAADGSDMILREKTKGTPLGDSKAVGAAYGVFANKAIKDFRNGGDRNARFTHYKGTYFREVKKGRAKFLNIVRNRAELLGKDADEWVRLVNDLGNEFSNEDVMRVLGDERLARDWREIVGQADRTAYKSVNDKFFTYRQLKIDEKLRYFVFYHYWMSRAFRLHGKAALQNPALMNAYINMWQGMENDAEANGYPSGVIGTLRFMREGYVGFFDPLGIIVPFDILLDKAQTDQGVADWVRSHGAFFNPIIDGALSYAGFTSRVADLTQTKAVRRRIKSFINYMNSNGHEGWIPDQIAGPNSLAIDYVDVVQERIAEKVNSILPKSWEKDFTEPDGYEMDAVNSILMTQMEAELGPNSNWSDQEWEDYLSAQESILLHRDGNDYADAAVEAYSDAEMAVENLKTIVPGGVYARYGPRDAEMRDRDLGYDDAYDNRSLATSGSPEDAALTVGINRLEDVGTENGRNAYKAWNEIANFGGDDLELSTIGKFITINGEDIYAGDIANMSYDERVALADRWLGQYGDSPNDLAEYRKEREAYLLKHPEVGDFKEFQKGVYGMANQPGGIKAWRELAAKQNPEFAAAMADYEKYLRADGKYASGAGHTQQGIIDRELDQWAASQSAYKVLNGVQDSIYSSPVTPTVPNIHQPSYGFPDQSSGGGSSGGSTGSSTPKTPIQKTQTTIENYNDKIAKAVAVMNASGYDVTAEDLIYANSYYRQAWGLFDIPDMPYDANLYYQWVLMQPNGADTSVSSYLKVLEDSGYSAAA